MSDARKWWDRWIVGFWGGVAAMSIIWPFMHPPTIRVLQLTDADSSKIAAEIAKALAEARP